MDSIELQELVRPQDTKTFASDQLVKLRSLPHKAEVLGYVSAQRSISPELLRPLDLHSKRSSSLSMGASCSKSSSVGLSSKANDNLRSSTQSVSSPYLTNKLSSSKSSKTAQSAAGAEANNTDLIQAQHQPDPAGQLQNALAASAATAVLSEASDRAATAVAAGTLPQPPQQPSSAQQSLLEASAVYNRPLDRPAYHHRTASGKRRTGSLISHAPFPEALKAVVRRPSEEGFTQLLQQHLFESQDMKVMDLDSLVAAIARQPAQTQASCASMMVANAFYFAAMKAVFVLPEVLKAVLDDIHLQVDVQQPERVDSWRWADLDLHLLLQQFRGLKVTQQYKQTQMQLTALGPEGQAPLARVQMEMLGKVVDDFLAQLGAQLSSLPAVAEATPGMTEPGTDTEAPGSWSKLGDVDGGRGLGKGLAKGHGGSSGGARRGEVGGLTSSQVKKRTGLQQKREQLKAGERHKRQQAATLGVSPTLVARSQMSARSVAQQQVLTQRQQREGAAAVAQRAAAEKLQLEQQALERDYEQLRREQLRFEEEQQWAAQQQAQPSTSQPQAQSRFAQESMLPMAGGVSPKDQASEALGFGSMDSAPSVQGPAYNSSLTEGTRSQYASMIQGGSSKQASMTAPAKYEQDDSLDFLPAQRRAPTQHAMSELEQQGWAAVNSPAGQTIAAQQAASPDEVAALAVQNSRGGHRSQHTLSEQEQQGSTAKPLSTVQGSVAQPLLRGPSPQEHELVASHQPTGAASPPRDSPTRDLTELEQHGSFTLTPDPSQRQAGNLDGAEAAELARELARRKGAQAELERQYSQLQLQHQQSLEKHHQQARLAQQAQHEEEDRLQQAKAAGEAEEQRLEEQRAQQEQARLEAELARQQAEEEDRRQQQAMAREAKELAKQRAELEAALAAERGDAQGHGYTPTPLATPKPVKGGTDAEDADASEVEEEAASGSDEEEVSSESGASDSEDEGAKAKRRTGKTLNSKFDDAASSVESESDAEESEDYQEDFEEEEGQAPAAAAAQKKNGLQSGGSVAAGRKANGKAPTTKQRRTSSSSSKPAMAPTSTPPMSDSPDPTALKWAAKNPWFGTDVEMTYFAYEVHDQLIEEERITADMPEYYTLISARVEAQFPERFFPPGSTGMQRQGSIILAGGQVSTAGVSPMYRQGSSIGSGNYQYGPSMAPAMYRQSSNMGPSMYRQGSVVGPAVYQQDTSLGPSLYRQASSLAPQLSGGAPYAPKLYRGSSAVAALTQQQQQDQLRAVAAKRPVMPVLPLPQGTNGKASPRLAGPRSDRGVGSLYDNRTGTPRIHAASPTSSGDMSNQMAADMAWAVGQRADMA